MSVVRSPDVTTPTAWTFSSPELNTTSLFRRGVTVFHPPLASIKCNAPPAKSTPSPSDRYSTALTSYSGTFALSTWGLQYPCASIGALCANGRDGRLAGDDVGEDRADGAKGRGVIPRVGTLRSVAFGGDAGDDGVDAVNGPTRGLRHRP